MSFYNDGQENSEIIIKFIQIVDKMCVFKTNLKENWKGRWTMKSLNNFLITKNINELDTKGLELVEWCVDFLILLSNPKIKDDDKIKFPKKPQNKGYVEYKYISLWSFIYNFLQIPKDCGFDYILMEFLEKNNIIDYGSGIRSAWFNEACYNPYKDRIVSEERKNEIIKWAENAPDNI
jgi:hypothetical protein